QFGAIRRSGCPMDGCPIRQMGLHGLPELPRRAGGGRLPPMNIPKLTAALSFTLALAACTPSTESTDRTAADAGASPPDMDADSDGLAPADEFLARLAQHCGQAFAGRIVANEPPTTEPDAFEGRELIMHVRGCDDPTRELQVPFHVGDNHSRTWI